MLILVGCVKQQSSNLYVIPDGYRGPLLVILVEGVDQAFERQGLKNIYTFPESGVLCVASFDNFEGLRQHDAMYSSGRPIPGGDETDYIDDRFELLKLRWSKTLTSADGVTTTLSDPEILMGIGSAKELREIDSAWDDEDPIFRRDQCGDVNTL
jgi:hypothetical protein